MITDYLCFFRYLLRHASTLLALLSRDLDSLQSGFINQAQDPADFHMYTSKTVHDVYDLQYVVFLVIIRDWKTDYGRMDFSSKWVVIFIQ